MAIEETVVIKTDTKSLADLRKEITSIQAELDLTPTGTKEYDALVVRLRQAKGEIKDFKEATKGLDPDQRAAKLVNAFQGMTGAIQATAGAITLFGGNSEDLSKVEKNLLGIIAIGGGVQQTIEGFNDAADIIGPSFTKLGASIKGAFITAEGGVNKFRLALASIGIAALIAGVTYLVQNFDKLGLAIKTDADSVDELAESNEALLNSINLQNESIDAETQLLKAQGVELEKINEIKIKGLEITNQQLEQQNQELTQKIFSYYQDLNRELTEDEEKRVARLEELRTKNENDIKKNNAAILNLKQEVIDEDAKKEEKANADALKRQEKANADLKKLQEDRKVFILKLNTDLATSLEELNKESAKTEKEQLEADFAATFAELERQRKERVAEAERLGLNALKVNEIYDNLNEAQRIKYNNSLIAIDKAASDKIITERKQQLESQLSAVEAQYSRILSNIENAAAQIALTQNVATKEQFDDINVFVANAINDTQAALEQQNLDQATTIRNRVNITVKLLEEEQLKRQQILQQQTDDAIKNNGIFSKEAKDAQDKQAADFQAFQDRKLQIITNGSKELLAVDNATTQKQLENREQLNSLIYNSTKSLFSDLITITQNNDKDSEEAAKKTFERQKAFSIATTLIDTYVAAQKAYASQIIVGDPTSIVRAQIAAGVTIAAGLARVAAISSQKFDSTNPGAGINTGTGTNGGGGSNVLNPFAAQGGGGTNVLPPRLAPKRNPNEFQADTTGQFGELGATTPIFRTYVLAGDVTDAQVANEKINQKRKL